MVVDVVAEVVALVAGGGIDDDDGDDAGASFLPVPNWNLELLLPSTVSAALSCLSFPDVSFCNDGGATLVLELVAESASFCCSLCSSSSS